MLRPTIVGLFEKTAHRKLQLTVTINKLAFTFGLPDACDWKTMAGDNKYNAQVKLINEYVRQPTLHYE